MQLSHNTEKQIHGNPNFGKARFWPGNSRGAFVCLLLYNLSRYRLLIKKHPDSIKTGRQLF
jgi:hypothetical protein